MTINVQQADQMPFEGAAMFVVGNFKSGKTVLAHTASQFAPVPLTPGKPTLLPDVAYIGLEPGGIRAATAMGLNAKHVLDLSTSEYRVPFDADADVVAGKGASNEMQLDWTKIRPALVAFAKYVKANPEIKVVIFDHLTRLSDCLEAHYRTPKFAPKTDKGAIDTFGIFRLIKDTNQWLAAVYFDARVLFIALAHVKTVAKEADQNKLDSKSVGGDATDMIPAVPTATAGFWSGYSDAVISTLRKKVKTGIETKYQYKMVMTSSNKLPSGNRFGMEGEHDSHLGPTVKKNYPNL
jgi:hypothetical protein